MVPSSPTPAVTGPVAAAPPGDGYLGPARVLATAPWLAVRLEQEVDAVREVELALTFPYEPVVGDRLLVIESPAGCWAIGLLEGQGPAVLGFQGDLDLHAAGTLTLSGEDAVELEGPRLTLRGESLRTFAGTLTEKADEAYRWVKGLLTVRAGQAERTIDGEDHSRSERTVILAKGTVKIDGSYLNLGS